MSNRIDLTELEKRFTEGLGGPYTVLQMDLISELKRCYERIDYLERIAEEYRQERPEEYCANCYAYLEDYDGDGVKECLCRNCEASEAE